MIPVIMAGGSGSRLWPLSRALYPKQFIALDGQASMLQATLARLQGLSDQPATIICNEDHRFIVAEQIRSSGQPLGSLILEPVGRNTAPAIALAALDAVKSGEDPLLLVLAADHVIRDVPAFQSAVRQAQALAEDGKLVTFGIVPNHAETGYGYVRAGRLAGSAVELVDAVFPVAEFVEKPDFDTAQRYVDSKEYYWNSGMFMFRASRYLNELKAYRPDILAACETAIQHATKDLDFVRVDKAAFAACPEDSIDYAVMEKTRDAWVVPLDAQWNDVGSWSALWEIGDKDQNNNLLKGDVLTHATRNSYVNASEKLVATVGLDNVVVVETKDAVLVAAKDQVQEVKRIVESLKAQGRSEHSQHRQVYRPWGHYDSIDTGKRYQVKRITVSPGDKLSIQMHHHRAEHWIVVSGTARVCKGDEQVLLTENQSIYIPVGVVHSLENPGRIPLELIEVQSGSYLGEDDIVRFEDRYGRA